MAQAFEISLKEEQIKELSWARDHHKKSYVRMRAAAILKVNSGLSVRQVALTGLLKPVTEEQVSEWIRRYLSEGLDGLLVRGGRGRKPAFSPCGLSYEQAIYQVGEVVHQDPHLFGIDRSGWTLLSVRSVIGWMHQLTLSAVSRILSRFDLVYKRGQAHVHSPDPLYQPKLATIEQARSQARQAPGKVIFLYVDEHTANVRPLSGPTYAQRGGPASKATGSASHPVRLAGALDIATGQVLVRRRSSFNVKEMYRFFYHIEQHYPEAEIIYIALDNWPNHFHGYVRDHLAKIKSKIRLLPLPTYAPWTNPIEKFWLKLNREFMKQHRYGLRLRAFYDALDLWLDKHRESSRALLHEVGLFPQKEAFPYPY